MKRQILALSLVFLGWAVNGQVLSIDPDVTTVNGPVTSTDIGSHTTVTNVSDDTVRLLWDRVIVSFNQGWTSWICDQNLCYTPGVASCPPNYPNVLGPGESLDFQIHINPAGTMGTAEIHAPLYSEDDPNTILGTVKAQFETSTTSVEDLGIDAIRIYPNPTTSHFEIRNGGNVQKVILHSLVGTKVREFDARLSSRFDVSELPQGIYLVRMLDANLGVVKTVRLSKR